MAIQRGSAFVGMQAAEALPRRPITAAQHAQRCAQDQGRNYERLTDKDATDGTTTASVNRGHTHEEEGNLIYHMLMYQSFGASAGGVYNHPDNAGGEIQVDQRAICLYPTPGMTAQLPTIFLYPLVFVPAGHQNRDILLLVGTNKTDPIAKATVQDGSLNNLSGYTRVPLEQMRLSSFLVAEDDDQGAVYGIRFQVSAAGIYAVKLETYIDETMANREIHWIMAITEFNPLNRTQVLAEPVSPPVPGSNLVTVGNPDAAGNNWHPVDGNLVSEDGPPGAGLVIMTHNNHMLWEDATGLPAPGNATRQRTPHKHRGSGESGREIEYPMWAGCFGGLWGDSLTEVTGNRSRFPRTNETGPPSTTRRTVARGRLYLPDSANVTGGGSPTSRLRAYFLVFCESGKGNTIEVRLQLGANNYDYQSTGFTGASPNFKFGILSVDTGGVTFLTYSANAANDYFIQLRKAVDGGADTVGLLSATIVVDAP